MRAVGGWDLMFGTKSQIKPFFLGPSLSEAVSKSETFSHCFDDGHG